jgi:hypothetical protein
MVVQDPRIGDRRPVGGDESMDAIRLDAFASYARIDSEHAEAMVEAARGHGRMLWIDSDGIPPGAPWRGELGSAIEAAFPFVCILSPHWRRSRECELEYRRAASLRLLGLFADRTSSLRDSQTANDQEGS